LLLGLAVSVSMAAAVSLGMTRFAYALLLPPMREDLSWTYTLAGAMNTFNALGYLVGALLTPRALKKWGAVSVLIVGSVTASCLMALTGFFTDSSVLLAQRLLAGVASASVFVSGGLLAARLGSHAPSQSGLLLGIYYGGTGWGIVLSALCVPWTIARAAAENAQHAWSWAWWGLAFLCAFISLMLYVLRQQLHQWMPELPHTAVAAQDDKTFTKGNRPSNTEATTTKSSALRVWAAGLLGYGLFGVGYIGYMTFVVAVLREQGAPPERITFFYAALGLAVVASSRIWAGLLNHYRGGQALSILNALLSVATIIPALTSDYAAMMLSGILFGGVFLSVVASTTAMVKHNLPADQWASGISIFTVVFALGQIVGPTVVGWIADGPGGLQRGLVFSAAALLLGAVVAWQQKPLPAQTS